MKHATDFRDSQKTVYEIPPKKKQRGYQAGDDVDLFVPLMEGEEPAENILLRRSLFSRYWNIQQERINDVLSNINRDVTGRIVHSLLAGDSHVLSNSTIGQNLKKLSHNRLTFLPTSYNKIKTVIVNSEITSQGSLFEQLGEQLEMGDKSIKVVYLSSNFSGTPKKLLKNMITQIVESANADSDPDLSDDEDVGPSEYNSYDFESIMTWYMDKAASTDFKKPPVVVVVLKDVDSFKSNVLEFFLQLLKSYSSRMDIKLVMGKISNSDLFQEKLPRSLSKEFEVQSFYLDICRKTLDEILMATLFSDKFPDDLIPLMFSQQMIRIVLKRQADSSPSIEAFVSLLKYAYMTHFFGQPLSVLAISTGYLLNSSIVKRLRLLKSFQFFVEGIVGDAELGKDDKSKIIGQLLNDDSMTGALVSDNFLKLRKWRIYLNSCIRLCRLIIETNGDSIISGADILDQLLQHPTLVKMPFYKSVCSALSRFTPRDVVAVLKYLNENQHNQLFSRFYKKARKIAQPLSQLSSDINADEKDTFKKISDNLTELIEDVLRKCVDPLVKKDLLFLEAITLDVAGDSQENLVTAAFLPAVRSAVQLSLSDPSAYFLQANATEETLSQEAVLNKLSNVCEPNLCELFRLYREANVSINIYDFFNAFTLRMSSERVAPVLADCLTSSGDFPDLSKSEAKNMVDALRSTEGSQVWDKIALSWFLQGISELRYLGFLKDSRKRVEAVDKNVWKGL